MIGLMDCNNFFVSCERLFRPDLINKPVAVLSSNNGCIIARSQEVKDLGVQMGVPYFEVKDLCKKHSVVLFSTNLTLYRDISARVMSALRSEFQICEVYSVDEAFFEIDDSVTEDEILAIRQRILQKTGIPVSFGIASTKTRAKVASKLAKKGTGVCILNEIMWGNIKSDLLCGSIWGIGRQTSAFLSKSKIYSVSELLSQDRTFITQNLGVIGERLIMELAGVSVYRIGKNNDEEQQSYTSTRSFAKPIFEKRVVMSALGYHVAHLAEKLRKDSCVASTLTIIARGSRYGSFGHRDGTLSTVLPMPTHDTITLTKEVTRLFDALYDPEIPYKKAGVVVSGIEPSYVATQSLFSDSKTQEKNEKLNSTADALNARFGSGTVRSGVTLGMEKWKSKSAKISNEYTTRWSEIASVKAV